MFRSLTMVVASLAVIGFSSQAHAGEPRLLGDYGAWEAYVFFENGQKVCYMASQPTKAEGDYTKRGDPFALITHRPADDTRDVFSYITGYNYKTGSEAKAIIDGKEFVLYTQDETAWGPDPETDTKLADAIKNGSKLVIKGISSRGTHTTDTYSLSGSSKAYKKISQECDD